MHHTATVVKRFATLSQLATDTPPLSRNAEQAAPPLLQAVKLRCRCSLQTYPVQNTAGTPGAAPRLRSGCGCTAPRLC
jgi:hypothetical protein